METKTFESAWQWTKTGGVVLWNGYTLVKAYRTRPIYGAANFWPDLKTWLTAYNPVFRKIAAASPPAWDDKLVSAIDDVLQDETLWKLFERTVSGGAKVPDESIRYSIRDRVRVRLGNMFRLTRDDVDLQTLESFQEENVESIATAIAILSLIASSANIIQFIRNWRKAAK